jgi:hypothetical protein
MNEFKILKTEKRHALKDEYITPVNLPYIPPVCKVITTYFEPRFMNANEYTQLHTGTGYIDCIALDEVKRLQYYEYEVITEWEGDIEYTLEHYSLKWILT